MAGFEKKAAVPAVSPPDARAVFALLCSFPVLRFPKRSTVVGNVTDAFGASVANAKVIGRAYGPEPFPPTPMKWQLQFLRSTARTYEVGTPGRSETGQGHPARWHPQFSRPEYPGPRRAKPEGQHAAFLDPQVSLATRFNGQSAKTFRESETEPAASRRFGGRLLHFE